MGKPTLLDKLLEDRKKAALRRHNPAADMLACLQTWIGAFEQELGADREVGIMTSSSPALRLAEIGIAEPDLLIFLGTDESGLRTLIIQHHSQCAITLIQLPKLNAQAFRMGFIARNRPTED